MSAISFGEVVANEATVFPFLVDGYVYGKKTYSIYQIKNNCMSDKKSKGLPRKSNLRESNRQFTREEALALLFLFVALVANLIVLMNFLFG